MKIKKNVILGIIVLLIAGGIFWSYSAYKKPGKYDDFAKCLTESGAKFYGTFWCPACNQQKKLFGKSIKYVGYVECSTPDRRGQTPACVQEEINGYPTWKFNDGSKVQGILELEELGQRANCQLII